MEANVVGKEYSEVDRAYVAGFVDADGAVMAHIEPHHEKRFKFRIRLEFKITQRDRHVLDYFHKKFQTGHVVQNRSAFDWRTRAQDDVVRMLELIRPYSVVKRKQIDIALTIAKSKINSKQDLLRVAKLADTLSKFNVRSANRRRNYAIKIQEYFSCND